MITRATRIKLIVFISIAVLSVAYVGVNYAGLDRFLGPSGYLVTAQFVDSGGIFEGAQVTYRGVSVGQVDDLELTDAGLNVALDIEEDTPPIPADTTATVANRSAVGEQYVDLRPNSDGEPYLEGGSVIRQENTGIPTAPHDMLSNLDELVRSVNTDSLRTVVNEADRAFSGTGQDLQVLLDTAHSFTARAQESLPETQQLLSSGRTVLDNQRRNADDITELSSGLREISEQFAESDGDLRQVVDRAPEVGQEVSDFLATSGNHMGALLANLLTTADIAAVRTDSTEQLMVNFAVIGAFGQSADEGGRGRLGIVLDLFDPPSCTKGYEGTEQRPSSDESDVEPNTEAYCAEPEGSPIGVRGAQNTPYAGEPAEVAPPEQNEQEDQAPQDQLPGVLDEPTEQRAPSGDGIGDLLGLNE